MIGISLDIPEVATRQGGSGGLPIINGLSPAWSADFTTEGTTNQYFLAGVKSASAAAWLTAMSGTITRATSATYTQGGVVKTAGTATLRFPTDAGGLPLGMRVTMAAQTELCLWNRDLTNAVWTATTATVAKDQAGADGTATSASSILATAGNATVLQTITSGSAARVSGAYVKRLVGTGIINMTQDNGSTWTPITLTAAWTFVSIPQQTLTNPIVGFQIVTNGDQIAVDFVSNRIAAVVFDVIATTTVTVTQNADQIKATPISSWFSAAGGTLLASFFWENTTTNTVLALNASGTYSTGPGFTSEFSLPTHFYQAGGSGSSSNVSNSTGSPQKSAGIYNVASTLQRIVTIANSNENATLDFTGGTTNQLQFAARNSGGTLGGFGNLRAIAYYATTAAVQEARNALQVMS